MSIHRHLAPMIYAPFKDITWRFSSKENHIYLTFDDGPFPPLTRPIMKYLREENITATFFLSGVNLFKYRHEIRKLNYKPHGLGSHFYYHHPPIGLRRKTIERELEQTDRLIETYLKRRTNIFRPPFGIFGHSLLKSLNRMDKKMILWSVMANDFKWDAGRILEHLKASVRNGDIVVFHDSPKTEGVLLDVLPQFITEFRRRGYQFRRIDE